MSMEGPCQLQDSFQMEGQAWGQRKCQPPGPGWQQPEHLQAWAGWHLYPESGEHLGWEAGVWAGSWGRGGKQWGEEFGGQGIQGERQTSSRPAWLAWPIGEASVGACHPQNIAPGRSPMQVSQWGSLDAHTPYPRSTLPHPTRRLTQGLTHQSRPHCSGQTPCTSLEITEQKLALTGKQGCPLQGPRDSLEGSWLGPQSAHTILLTPRRGLDTSPVIPLGKTIVSGKRACPPASPAHRHHGERCPGATLTLYQEGQRLPPRPPVWAGCIRVGCKVTGINPRPWRCRSAGFGRQKLVCFQSISGDSDGQLGVRTPNLRSPCSSELLVAGGRSWLPLRI